jgi:hypothetical protein
MIPLSGAAGGCDTSGGVNAISFDVTVTGWSNGNIVSPPSREGGEAEAVHTTSLSKKQ